MTNSIMSWICLTCLFWTLMSICSLSTGSTTTTTSAVLPVWLHSNFTTQSIRIHDWPFFTRHNEFDHTNYYSTMSSLIREYLPRVLRNTYESNQRLFPYYNTDLAKEYSNFQKEYLLKDIPASKLCPTSESDESNGKYYYYSGDLMQNQFTALRRDLPLQELFEDVGSLDGLTAHVWIGQPLVMATMHYDAVHNLFIQLHGKKKIRLIAPRFVEKMKLYGRNHIFACQSRYLDVRTGKYIRKEAFSLIGNSYFGIPEHCEAAKNDIHVYEVELKPMEILYIPPYWLHDAEAESCSMSVSLWWETKLTASMNDIMGLPLPIESNWSPDNTIFAIFDYLKKIITKIERYLLGPYPQKDFLSTMKLLLKERYEEDFQYANNMEILWPSGKIEPSSQKIDRYSSIAAAKLMELIFKMDGSLQEESAGLSISILAALIQKETLENMLHDKFVDHDINYISLENGFAILSLKVADYIEEVLSFLAKVLNRSNDQVAFLKSHQN